MSGTEERYWQCRDRRIPFGRTLVMGIVNVTPDSFSDGGLWLDPDLAVAHGRQLIDEGADLLDVGGESTRPGSAEVAAEEEARRILPVIRGLAESGSVPVSVDTRHAEVARAAVAAGACIVNDILPVTGDAAMMEVLRETGAGAVLMHMRGTPQSMSSFADYGDVVGEVLSALRDALAEAEAQGVARDRLVVDPGIGFAKNTEQNVALLAATAQLAQLGPLLVGASRKRFIGELCREPLAGGRLGGSVGAAVWCALRGAAVVRVHDVKATRQALAVAELLADKERLIKAYV